jgi:hypothetical protein
MNLPNDKTYVLRRSLWTLANSYSISQTDLAAVFAPMEGKPDMNCEGLESYHFWVSNVDNI